MTRFSNVILTAVLLAAMILCVANDTGLSADGANFLLHIVSAKQLFAPMPFRIAANVITQYPVLFAQDLGLPLQALAALQTSMLVGIPTACFITTLWMCSRNVLTVAANTVVLTCVYFPTLFHLIGEHHIPSTRCSGYAPF